MSHIKQPQESISRECSSGQLSQRVMRHVAKREFRKIGELGGVEAAQVVVGHIQGLNVPQSPERILDEFVEAVPVEVQGAQALERRERVARHGRDFAVGDVQLEQLPREGGALKGRRVQLGDVVPFQSEERHVPQGLQGA